MGNILRLVVNRLGVVLLISVVFLSATQQVLPTTEQTKPPNFSEAVPATYPELNFSTYFGGSAGLDHGKGIAVTEDGCYYLMDQTASSDFPTLNAYNSTFSGNRDVFITKFNVSGSLLWSTFFGGSGLDVGRDISVAGDGSCYVIGETQSSDFPTQNAFSSTFSGNEDTFLAKFSTNGTLLWSSYLGGNDNEAGEGIAVTSDGSCYVTGRTRSNNFPALDAYDPTPNGSWDVFITKFSTSGSLLWSTFFGGALWDEALGITVAGDGSCYVTGYTVSPDFPTKHAYSISNSGWGDAFVVKFTTTGSLLWSTFLGGNGGDRGYAIETSSDGSCYVTGETSSTNFPTKNTTTDSLSSGFDAFVTEFSSEGFLLWSTYLGGCQTDKGYGIAATDDGSCYIVGTTHSPDFPTKNAFDNTLGATSDAFVTKFDNTPISATQPSTVPGFLVFIAVMPILAFMPVIALIVYKKRK